MLVVIGDCQLWVGFASTPDEERSPAAELFVRRPMAAFPRSVDLHGVSGRRREQPLGGSQREFAR